MNPLAKSNFESEVLDLFLSTLSSQMKIFLIPVKFDVCQATWGIACQRGLGVSSLPFGIWGLGFALPALLPAYSLPLCFGAC